MTILKDQEVYIDGYHLTADTQALSLLAEWGEVDDTVLNQTFRSVDLGLMSTTFDTQGLFNAANSDSGLYANLGLTGKPVAVINSQTDGATAYFFRSAVASYQPYGQSVGDLHGFSAGAAGRSPLFRGRRINKQIAATSSGTSAGVQLGAVASGQKIYVAAFVFGASSGDTLDLVLQSDDNSGFTSATSRITFNQFTGVGSEWRELAGPIADTYWAVDYTIAGTDPSFSFIIVAAIE